MTDETLLQKAEREKLEIETGALRAKAAAELKKTEAEADKAAVDAAVPAPPTVSGTVEGKTSDEDSDGMLGRMVAYRLLGDVAAEMAAAVPRPTDPGRKARVLLVEDRNLIATDWPYRLVGTQLAAEAEAVKEALERVSGLGAPGAAPTTGGGVETAIAPAVAIAAGSFAVSTVTSLIGLFRTDYTIKGGEAKIGTTPLLAATADALGAAGHIVVIDGFEQLQGALIESFSEARTKRLRLESEVAAKRTQYGPALPADGADPPAGSEAGRATLAAAEATMKAFDEFTKAVVTPGEKTPPLLVMAAQRERLHLPPADPRAVSHVLYVAVEGGGQEAILKHGSFGTNRRAAFLGGAEVSFLLHDVAENVTIAAGSRQLVGQIEFDLAERRAKAIERIPVEPS